MAKIRSNSESAVRYRDYSVSLRESLARHSEPYPPVDPDGTVHVTIAIPMALSRRISRYLKSRDRKSDVPTEIGVAVADLVSIGLTNLEDETRGYQFPAYAPAPEEIAARCREVQKTWEEKDWKQRRRKGDSDDDSAVNIPVFRAPLFTDGHRQSSEDG